MLRLLLVLFALGPTLAYAQSMGAADAPALKAALQDEGYRAVLETDSSGDPKITSSAGGSRFVIYFYGCSNNLNCQDLQFSVGFDKTNPSSSSLMNEWNRTKAVGTAFVDDEGDPFLQLYVPGTSKMTTASLKRVMSRWEVAVGQFKDHIDWN